MHILSWVSRYFMITLTVFSVRLDQCQDRYRNKYEARCHISLLRLPSITAGRAHRRAGLAVVWLTQLHSAVQIEVVRFGCEAKHVKAVANGGAFSVTARLSRAHVQKGDSLVVHTPG